MNLLVIAHCAFMFEFIIGSHVTNVCESRFGYSVVYGVIDNCVV